MIETEDLTQAQATTGSLDRLTLTTKEAAAMLQVSVPTLRTFIYRDADPLPVWRIGRAIRIPLQLLQGWVDRQATRERE